MWSNRPSIAHRQFYQKYNRPEGTVLAGDGDGGGGVVLVSVTHPFNPDPRVVVASRLVW